MGEGGEAEGWERGEKQRDGGGGRSRGMGEGGETEGWGRGEKQWDEGEADGEGEREKRKQRYVGQEPRFKAATC